MEILATIGDDALDLFLYFILHYCYKDKGLYSYLQHNYYSRRLFYLIIFKIWQ